MAELFRGANSQPRQGWDSAKNSKIESRHRHCEAIAKAEEELAGGDEMAPDLHTLHGKELRG